MGQSLAPQQHIAVGQRQPEVVLAQAQQDGIVDDPATLVGDERVLALPDAHRLRSRGVSMFVNANASAP